MCYYRALQSGPASVVVPIDKLSILVTIVFSWIVFHEKLTKKATAGLGCIVVGTILLAPVSYTHLNNITRLSFFIKRVFVN